LPVQQQQPRPRSAEHTSGTNNQRQQEQEADGKEFYSNIPGNRTSYGGETAEQTDTYENIDMVVNTAKVLQVFDDVLTQSDVAPTSQRRPPSMTARPRKTSQDDSADMLSMAESARQQLIQRRSRESDATEGQNAAVAGHKPVPQQRSVLPADQQAEQFKQLLAQKAANRRLPEDEVAEQSSRSTSHPVPLSRSAVPRSISVDAEASAAGKTWQQHPAVTEKSRSNDSSKQMPQRRSVEISRHQLPSPPPAPPAHAMSEDFDLPPPPEEYSNLPPMTVRPTGGLPPSTNGHPADRQLETAGKFRHHPTATPTPLSLTDNHDLPPPPSGFHDDIPLHPGFSQASPPFRTANVGGLAGNAGGLAGTGTVSGPMRGWSRDDVAHWLVTLNMPEHCAAFSAAAVNGQRLVQLTDDDLYALGVSQFGQRKMMRRAIENDS